MKRRLVISDIHGYGEALQRLLGEANYQSEKDQLVLLGDYIHKGPHSFQTLDIVQQLHHQGAIVLRGNHEKKVLRGEDFRDEVHLECGCAHSSC